MSRRVGGGQEEGRRRAGGGKEEGRTAERKKTNFAHLLYILVPLPSFH